MDKRIFSIVAQLADWTLAEKEKKSDKDALVSVDAADYVLPLFTDDWDWVKRWVDPALGSQGCPVR